MVVFANQEQVPRMILLIGDHFLYSIVDVEGRVSQLVSHTVSGCDCINGLGTYRFVVRNGSMNFHCFDEFNGFILWERKDVANFRPFTNGWGEPACFFDFSI